MVKRVLMSSHSLWYVLFFLTLQYCIGFAIYQHVVPLCLILVYYACIRHAVFKIKSSEGRKKAFGTCSSHLVVVFLFYGPGISMYLQPPSSISRDQPKFMALFYGVVTPALNPFIYTLRNKDVKGALGNLMRSIFTSKW